MKKQALAAATLSALTLGGVAHAQSSVTLYGVADMALAKVTGQSWRLAGASPLTNGSSRIGFRGIEDLGGGKWRISVRWQENRLADTNAVETFVYEMDLYP